MNFNIENIFSRLNIYSGNEYVGFVDLGIDLIVVDNDEKWKRDVYIKYFSVRDNLTSLGLDIIKQGYKFNNIRYVVDDFYYNVSYSDVIRVIRISNLKELVK